MAKFNVEIDTDHLTFVQHPSGAGTFCNPMVEISSDGVKDVMRQIAVAIGLDAETYPACGIQLTITDSRTGEKSWPMTTPDIAVMCSNINCSDKPATLALPIKNFRR